MVDALLLKYFWTRKERECPTVLSYYESHKKFKFPLYKCSVIIRFGYLKNKNMIGDLEFNSRESIRNCINKLKMKKLFVENNITTPKYFTNCPETFPIVIKNTNHSQGRGMRLIESKYELPRCFDDYYFEEFVKCDTEYRCHVMDGRVFHTDEKVLKKGYYSHWIKNLEKGYKYIRYKKRLPREMKEQIIKSVECLGLVFGAVDVGFNSETGNFYIYEVNSAPGMRTLTRKRYQKAIKRYVKKNYFIRRFLQWI